jgi:hypothetical protein
MALILSAYSLYDDNEAINKFNNNLSRSLKHCGYVSIKIIISILLIYRRSTFIILLVVIGTKSS